MTSPTATAHGLADAGRDAHYRGDIDGLRAFAVGSVVLYHAGIPWLTSGFVGVDVFFVISGYLIGGIILREVGEGRFRFADFYARRARRILPALFTVVAATCVLGWLMLDSASLRDLGASAVSALVAISNIRFWLSTDYFDAASHFDPMLMTWSLGVEEQFYIVFPFVLLAMGRLGASMKFAVLAGLTLASFVASLVLMRFDPQGAFYLLPSRAWELGIGAMLALMHLGGRTGDRSQLRSEAQGAAGFAMLVASFFVFSDATPFPGWAAILPVMGTAMLIDSPASFVNRRLLSAGPVVFIGLMSYSWYLWHWPLMTFVRIASPQAPQVWAMLAAAGVSFVLAYATWRWVEQPFRKRTLPSPALLVRYAIAGAVAVGAPLALRVGDGWPQRLPPAAASAEAAMGEGFDRCLLNFGDVSLPEGDCAPGPAGSPAVALLGDSHASSLVAGLGPVAAERGARLLVFTKSACPPLDGVTFHMADKPQHGGECSRYRDAAVDRILADADIEVVFVAGLWTIASWNDRDVFTPVDGPLARMEPRLALEQGLPALVARLTAGGKRVVVFGDVPNMDFQPPRLAMTLALPVRRALAEATAPMAGLTGEEVSLDHVSPKISEANGWVRDAVSGIEGATYVDLTQRFCTANACRFMQDGALWYFDDSHLTRAGSAHALAGFGRDLPILQKIEP